ncbi:MAG: FAD-dependent monooxygenase [Pseudomonadota bacterium]
MTGSTCEVMIVGAGPTGLSMAFELARRGISFRIIDKATAPSSHSKALAVHARTLECFYDMELIQEILAKGHKVQQINAYLDKEPRLGLSLNQLADTPFPYVNMIPQNVLEGIMIEQLEQKGSKIEWGVELTSLTPHANHVVLGTSKGKTKKQIKASWVIGCDGAHSKVRDELDIPFSGSRYEDQFLLADVALTSELNPQQGHLFLDEEVLAVFPMGQGMSRVITTYPSQDATPSDKHIKELLEDRFKNLSPVPVSMSQLQWTSFFNIHRRIVEKMQVGRVFLAGDAAHIHSPVGGQGMNTGIQDAYNLAWKLALHLQGKVKQDFLESYQVERHPVAVGVLLGTNIAMKMIMVRTHFLRKARNIIAPLIFNLPYLHRRLQTLISETAIQYRTSPIVFHEDSSKDWAITWIKSKVRRRLQPGDRAPNAPLAIAKTYDHISLFELTQKSPDHTLLLFLGSAAKEIKTYAKQLQQLVAECPDFLSGHFIVSEQSIDYNLLDQVDELFYLDRNGRAHGSYNIIKPTLCLIRPDGYVAYLGAAEDEKGFKQYLCEHFVLTTKPVVNVSENKKQVQAQ